jgi:hypothetical protein
VIVIVSILIAIYYVAYVGSRPSAVRSAWRTLLVSVLLALAIFSYSYYQAGNPPNVNYWQVGWTGYIRALNLELQAKGSPHRIPNPGE